MSIAALFLWGVMGLMVVFVTAYGMAMVSAFSTIMRVRWLEKRQNRRHNRALRAALLAYPGRQLMFRVVDGRMVVEVIPPDGEQIGPNAYRYNLRDFMAGGGGGEITGPSEGTNGGGHG